MGNKATSVIHLRWQEDQTMMLIWRINHHFYEFVQWSPWKNKFPTWNKFTFPKKTEHNSQHTSNNYDCFITKQLLHLRQLFESMLLCFRHQNDYKMRYRNLLV